jgi:hypothetical protein
MPARHAVLLIPPVSVRPSQLPCYKQHEQTNFHSPYTLPSSVSCKSCVCHSYANTRGVGVFFPFWNLLVGCWRFDPGSQRLSRSSTDYCQLITDLSTDLPRPCRGHCHPCLKSFSCNTYGSPASVANKRLTAWLNSLDATLTKNRGGASAPRRSDFSTFRCAVCIPGGVTGRGRSDVATCFRVASLPRTLSGSLPSQPSPVLSFGRNLELTTYD